MNTDRQEIHQAIEGIVNELNQMVLSFFDAILGPPHQLYREYGSPYGDTEEGFSRWLEELSRAIPDYRRRK